MVGRILKHEWGMEWTIENDESQIHCVRRFGRMKRPEGGRSSHVTGTRMADSNNHELIMCRFAFYTIYDILDII